MRLTLLIRAHRSPDQLARLVAALRDDSIQIFVHIDKKVSQKPFQKAIADDSVRFIRKRHNVNWAGFSMIRATHNALLEMCTIWGDDPPDYVALLSGQDYPIVSNSELLSFLNRNAGREFISYAPLPTPFWGEQSRFRSEVRHFIDNRLLTWPANRTGTLREKWPRRLFWTTKLGKLLPPLKVPEGWTLYGGSSWWCLSSEAVRHILQTYADCKEIVDYFRWTLHSDEMFYQTVLMNSAFAPRLGAPYLGKTIGDELWFQTWVEGTTSPNVLTSNDFDAIRESGKLFARKFDPDQDSKILDLLDEARAEGRYTP